MERPCAHKLLRRTRLFGTSWHLPTLLVPKCLNPNGKSTTTPLGECLNQPLICLPPLRSVQSNTNCYTEMKESRTMKNVCALILTASVLLFFETQTADAYDCRAPDQRVIQAMNDAERRGTQSNSVSTQYCAAINVKRALIWNAQQCLNHDNSLGPQAREALREQIRVTRQGIASDKKGYAQLTSSGSSCRCWSQYCAD